MSTFKRSKPKPGGWKGESIPLNSMVKDEIEECIAMLCPWITDIDCRNGVMTLTNNEGDCKTIDISKCIDMSWLCQKILDKMPPPEEDIQKLFKANDRLPDFNGCIKGCLDNGMTYEASGGSVLPQNFVGGIFVDCVSGRACYIPGKAESVSIIFNGVEYTANDQGEIIFGFENNDTFGSGVVNGNNVTITFPGQAPFDVCLKPVKSVNGVLPDAAGNVNTPTDSLVQNVDGSYTHVAVDGTVVTISAVTNSSMVQTASGFTHTAGDGTVTNIDLCAIVAANCNSPMTVNPDGSVTYTDNAGVVTTIPAASPSSFAFNAAAGTITHTSGNGTVTTVAVCDLIAGCAPSMVPGPGQYQYTFNDGHGGTTVIDINELDMDINNMVLNGSVLNWTAENGTTGSVDICAVVAANCNATLVANPDGSFTFTDNAGAVTVIPPSAGETVTTMVTNPDGSITYTSENGTTTTIPAAAVSQLVESGGVVTHTSGDGSTTSFDICAIVAANCNSPMVVNPDGSITYTDNAGNVTTIPAVAGETVTTLVVNPDGSITYTSENGTVTNVPAATVSQLSETGGVVTHTSGDGSTTSFDICAIVSANCNSPMTVNPDGSITYVDNAGTVTVIPASVGETVTTLVKNPDGGFTYTSEDGTVTTCPGAVASQLAEVGGVVTHTSGDGTVSTLDICAIVAANCNSPMVVNPDGSITYTDNAGVVTVIPASVGETVTTLVANPDGSFTYTSEDGSVTNIPAPAAANNSQLSETDGVVTHTAGDGTEVTFDICAVVAANCNSPMTVNADGSITYTDNAGMMTVIPAPTEFPTFLRKDGSPYVAGDAVTPLNVDSMTDLARPIDSVLGDKIIGQTATGDCNLFDLPAQKKLVNGAGALLVADQGPDADACCVQEPLLEKCTQLPLDKNMEVLTEIACVKITTCASVPLLTFDSTTVPDTFDSAAQAEQEVLVEGYGITWTNPCKCPVHIQVYHHLGHAELGIAGATFYGKLEVSYDSVNWAPELNGSNCAVGHFGFTERSGLRHVHEQYQNVLADCVLVQPGETYTIDARLATRLRFPYTANWGTTIEPLVGLVLLGTTATEIKS